MKNKKNRKSYGEFSPSQIVKQAVRNENDSFYEIVRKLCGPNYWMWNRKAAKTIHKRIRKKLRQPFRRKNRGPLRAKASGKSETRPTRGIR